MMLINNICEDVHEDGIIYVLIINIAASERWSITILKRWGGRGVFGFSKTSVYSCI